MSGAAGDAVVELRRVVEPGRLECWLALRCARRGTLALHDDQHGTVARRGFGGDSGTIGVEIAKEAHRTARVVDGRSRHDDRLHAAQVHRAPCRRVTAWCQLLDPPTCCRHQVEIHDEGALGDVLPRGHNAEHALVRRIRATADLEQQLLAIGRPQLVGLHREVIDEAPALLPVRHDEAAWWAITIDCVDTRTVAAFWSAIFDTAVVEPGPDRPGWLRLQPLGPDQPPFINLQPVDAPKVDKVRLHIDVLVRYIDPAVQRVIALGGSDTGEREHLPRGRIALMRDPEGNEFCLLAPPDA
jgi:predicted enzyme related to lactoylglutathione lyase